MNSTKQLCRNSLERRRCFFSTTHRSMEWRSVTDGGNQISVNRLWRAQGTNSLFLSKSLHLGFIVANKYENHYIGSAFQYSEIFTGREISSKMNQEKNIHHLSLHVYDFRRDGFFKNWIFNLSSTASSARLISSNKGANALFHIASHTRGPSIHSNNRTMFLVRMLDCFFMSNLIKLYNSHPPLYRHPALTIF